MDLYAVNLTAGDLQVDDLDGIIIPASGNYQILPEFDLEKVHSSDDLLAYINADQVVLSYDGVVNETKQSSIDLLTDISKENLDIVEEIEQQRNVDMKEPTGFINRVDSQISFVDGGGTPRNFTIQPTASSYGYYINGVLKVKTTTDSIQITDVTGRHYIYFDGTTLSETTSINPALIYGPFVFIAVVYWNALAGYSIGPYDERHGLTMDGVTHSTFHSNVGTTHGSGLEIGDYSLEGDGSDNAHTRFSLSDGVINDEDIQASISHADTPSNYFEQVLKHVTGSYAEIPVYYMVGSGSVGSWRRDNPSHSPLKFNAGTDHIQYNKWDDVAEEWVLEDVPYGRYIAMWVFGTLNINEPVIAVLGRVVSPSASESRLDNDLSMLNIIAQHYRETTPTPEVKILYRCIYKSTNSTNDFRASLHEYEDMRDITMIGAASATFALASQVAQVEDILGTNLKNIMLNSLEIARLKQSDLHPDFTYFVDVLADDEEIDPESANYYINENEGYVSLDPGGNYSVKDTTQAQFDLGAYTNLESFIDFGGDGAVRKEQLTVGDLSTIEDFEEVSNVVTSGAATQAQSQIPGTFMEGENSLGITVDFGGSSLAETAETEISFTPYAQDMSAYKFLRLYFFKSEEGSMNYDIEFEDSVASTWNSVQQPLNKANVFQVIEVPLNSVTGIDKSNIVAIRFRLYEQSSGQVILDASGVASTNTIYDGREGEQTFQVATNQTCQRIRLRLSGDTPTEPLYVGLADVFGSTLALCAVQPGDVTGTLQDFYLTFSTPVDLVAGIQYKIKLYSQTVNNDAYTVSTHTDTYSEGAYFQNGGDTNRDLNFIIYTPAIFETIYIDNLEIEAESSYEPTGTFVSRGIGFGLVPDSLTSLKWTLNLGASHDTIRVRVRFADSEGNLASAAWSGYYTDPTGVGNDLGPLTQNLWFQYEISFTGGDGTDSDWVTDLTLEYAAGAGTGSATIISTVENTVEVPDQFLMYWSDVKGTGSVNYYISRDGKSTWQHVLEVEAGNIVGFTDADPGTQIHLKAVISGNARLYSWMAATNKEFL